MDKYIGRLLDNRYEILEIIGTGGMAVVYKARCHRLNRLVAIKILKDDYMEDEEFRRRFHSESQAVAMLSHPNIVSVYDVSSSVNADYIVMELIDGITLKQYMEKKGVLNWKETLHFAIQIGKALEHAHSRGIVHRDIKPHNVMVLKNGSVKVTDFGIARMMSQSHTLTKEALGSVHYISPEQAKGGRVDNRSDIYSLGVVMYEMMSGRPPYDGESPVAVAIQHINGGAPLPSTLNPNIPAGLEQIIMHSMALEPSGRYATATMMLTDMDEFRKNPGILFDYNIPGLGEQIKQRKAPLVLEPDPVVITIPVEEEKQSNDAPPIVIAPKKQTGATSGNGTARKPARSRQGKRKQEKESNVATIAIISCAALMVLAVVVFVIVLLGSGSGSEVEYVDIPQLLGQDFEAVKNDDSLGVEIKLNEKKYSSEYPAGQIMYQNPASGGQIAKGSSIAVDVSLGEEPAPVMMPEILGWEQSEAERALNNLGIKLDVVIVEENHDEIEAGKVISTDPVAKEQLTENQKVTVVISLGMEYKTALMLDVVGDERATAESRLKSQPLKLDLVIEEVFDSVVQPGYVIRTEPEADMVISTGEKVTIYISKGPEMKALKNVIGMSADIAINILKGEDFKNYTIQRTSSDKAKDTVIELRVNDTVVAAGDKIDVNTMITIVVSDGPGSGDETQRKKLVNVELSEDFSPPYKLIIRQGEELVYEEQIDNDELEKVQIELVGIGEQTYDVYIDDKVYMKLKVDFSKE